MDDYPLNYASPADIELRRLAGKPLFGLWRPVATPAALALLAAAQCHPARLLQRHRCGDWGELCAADQAANAQALLSGGRLMSVYRVNNERLYVITEAVNDAIGLRDSTCILLPSEY